MAKLNGNREEREELGIIPILVEGVESKRGVEVEEWERAKNWWREEVREVG